MNPAVITNNTNVMCVLELCQCLAHCRLGFLTYASTNRLINVQQRGTAISWLTRGLATLRQGGSRSLQWSETGMEDPQEDPLAVHCFCVCSGSVLLGHLLGVSRSRERDLLSLLSIYPRIFLCIFIVYRRLVRILCLLLYSAIC